jgi:hypothetical protein
MSKGMKSKSTILKPNPSDNRSNSATLRSQGRGNSRVRCQQQNRGYSPWGWD